MEQKNAYGIIIKDLGIDHPQYFQGFSYLNREHTFVGQGDSLKEALENVQDYIAHSVDLPSGFYAEMATAVRETLESNPNAGTASELCEIFEEDLDDMFGETEFYYYVGCAFNLP